MNKNANDEIFKWRENLEMLPDDFFFNLVHIYIGEVRTPYNKQNLIERLEAILRTPQNQQTLLTYLDIFDEEILSFIAFVPNTTPEKISAFFSDEHTPAQINSQLQNLHERLLIYTELSDSSHKFIHINPVVKNILAQRLSLNSLLRTEESPETEKFIPCAETNLSPSLIASFISYIMERPDLCKADGSLKKTDATKLSAIFPDRLELIQNLLAALVNLSLINNDEKSLTINTPRLNEFTKLSEREQYIYLCVAASCPMSRTLLYTQAQLLLDCIAAMPAFGISRKVLLRTAFLTSELNSVADRNIRKHGRFSRILASAATDSDATLAHEDRSAQILFDRTIDTAIVFGLIRRASKDVSTHQEKFLSKSTILTEGEKKVVTISGLTITIVPGLSLKEFLSLVPFLSVTQYNTAVSFEVTHASVFRAFDYGYDSKQIYSVLQNYSAFAIPQNILATTDDWEQSYLSAVLYKGYVLQLDEKNAAVFEKNPNTAFKIIKKLAPGVYFLNITNDDDAAAFSHTSGFDFLGKTKTATHENASLPFSSLSLEETNSFHNQPDGESVFLSKPQTTLSDALAHKKNLLATLETLGFQKNKRDALEARIDRGIILSEEQLKNSFVQQTLIEAHGMDFSNKIHILENALQAHEKISVTLPSENDATTLVKYTGMPLFVNKKSNTPELVLQLDKSNDIKKFAIAQLTNIKWHKKL